MRGVDLPMGQLLSRLTSLKPPALPGVCYFFSVGSPDHVEGKGALFAASVVRTGRFLPVADHVAEPALLWTQTLHHIVHLPQPPHQRLHEFDGASGVVLDLG